MCWFLGLGGKELAEFTLGGGVETNVVNDKNILISTLSTHLISCYSSGYC